MGKGVKIKTVAPRFGVAARLGAAPRNPKVALRFDRDGTVIRAELVKSTGYAGLDGPILASLYKWRASGSMFDELKGQLEVEVHLLLHR